MNYKWHLIWHSMYGTEEIDSFDTLVEADKMRAEYIKAFGGEAGSIEIKKRRSK
jgi:hypothetical protein